MDSIAFIVGEQPVSFGLIGLVGLGLAVLLMVIVLILMVRGNRRQIEDAATNATETLRVNFQQQLNERDIRLREVGEKLDGARGESAALLAENAGLKAKMHEQARSAEENLKRFETARQQMAEQFKAVAGEILQTNSAVFQKQNREQVGVLLTPLREQIVAFQTQLTNDRATVGEQIRALSEQSMRMQTETGNLTRALKGSSQTQGAWGEMILATILERSGLREGEQFRTQQSHAGEPGSRLRTDVEILMPNADVLVIDSKVSLTAFEAYSSTEDGSDRQRHLRDHVNSIRTHVKGLGDKNYQRHAGSSLDFVMMFVPIEAALAEAVRADDRLIESAISQGVMLTTPTTLMTVLRTVRNVWDIEKRHENAEKIADRAGALYDKVAGFVSNMDRLGTHLERAQTSFSDARSQFVDGRGSVVRQVEILRELGAKTNKSLPKDWTPADEELLAPPEDAEND